VNLDTTSSVLLVLTRSGRQRNLYLRRNAICGSACAKASVLAHTTAFKPVQAVPANVEKTRTAAAHPVPAKAFANPGALPNAVWEVIIFDCASRLSPHRQRL
jgi:hypothetical protein